MTEITSKPSVINSAFIMLAPCYCCSLEFPLCKLYLVSTCSVSICSSTLSSAFSTKAVMPIVALISLRRCSYLGSTNSVIERVFLRMVVSFNPAHYYESDVVRHVEQRQYPRNNLAVLRKAYTFWNV